MNGSDRQFVENDIQRAKIVLTRILQIAQENQDQNLFNELNKQAGNTDITPQR